MMKKPLCIVLLAFSLLVIPVATVAFAAPADGVYDIAVIEVGEWNEWTADDFTELDVTYTWTTIPDSSLTASGLAAYDVLIIPWHHRYAWLDPAEATSIVDWVNSGNRLIVHNYWFDEALPNDPLMAAFGSDYYVDWTGEDGGFPGDSVVIIDSTNPLVSTPNTLSAAPLSNWMRTVHNSINPSTAGTAWNWAINSADSGYHWLGYAVSGSGAIILCCGDPEFHSTRSAGPQSTEARKLIENEIVFEWRELIATGWGVMWGKPPGYVRGPAELYMIGEAEMELVITFKDEEHSKTWEIREHYMKDAWEIFECYNPDYGFFKVKINSITGYVQAYGTIARFNGRLVDMNG